MDKQLSDALKTLTNAQLSIHQEQQQTNAEVGALRADVKELRQVVGLSMPPQGAPRREAQAAAWHATQVVRYGMVAAAGWASGQVADWLYRLLSNLGG